MPELLTSHSFWLLILATISLLVALALATREARAARASRATIRAVHATWIDAVNGGDLATLLRLVTDDAVFLTPSQPLAGREELRATFLSAHAQSQIRCTSDIEEVVVAGDIAWTRCRDTLTVTARAGGDTKRLAGHRLTVYRRQRDGRWLLARDAHTLVPVAT